MNQRVILPRARPATWRPVSEPRPEREGSGRNPSAEQPASVHHFGRMAVTSGGSAAADATAPIQANGPGHSTPEPESRAESGPEGLTLSNIRDGSKAPRIETLRTMEGHMLPVSHDDRESSATHFSHARAVPKVLTQPRSVSPLGSGAKGHAASLTAKQRRRLVPTRQIRHIHAKPPSARTKEEKKRLRFLLGGGKSPREKSSKNLQIARSIQAMDNRSRIKALEIAGIDQKTWGRIVARSRGRENVQVRAILAALTKR